MKHLWSPSSCRSHTRNLHMYPQNLDSMSWISILYPPFVRVMNSNNITSPSSSYWVSCTQYKWKSSIRRHKIKRKLKTVHEPQKHFHQYVLLNPSTTEYHIKTSMWNRYILLKLFFPLYFLPYRRTSHVLDFNESLLLLALHKTWSRHNIRVMTDHAKAFNLLITTKTNLVILDFKFLLW